MLRERPWRLWLRRYRIVIDGHTYVAEDTGSAIKGNRIDIYFDTHQEALNFGVQYADVYIIKN